MLDRSQKALFRLFVLNLIDSISWSHPLADNDRFLLTSDEIVELMFIGLTAIWVELFIEFFEPTINFVELFTGSVELVTNLVVVVVDFFGLAANLVELTADLVELAIGFVVFVTDVIGLTTAVELTADFVGLAGNSVELTVELDRTLLANLDQLLADFIGLFTDFVVELVGFRGLAAIFLDVLTGNFLQNSLSTVPNFWIKPVI